MKVDPKDDELRKLLKAAVHNEDCRREMEDLYARVLAAKETIEVMTEAAAQRLVQSGLDLSDTPQERVALLTQYVEFMKQVENYTQARFEAARARPAGKIRIKSATSAWTRRSSCCGPNARPTKRRGSDQWISW